MLTSQTANVLLFSRVLRSHDALFLQLQFTAVTLVLYMYDTVLLTPQPRHLLWNFCSPKKLRHTKFAARFCLLRTVS